VATTTAIALERIKLRYRAEAATTTATTATAAVVSSAQTECTGADTIPDQFLSNAAVSRYYSVGAP